MTVERNATLSHERLRPPSLTLVAILVGILLILPVSAAEHRVAPQGAEFTSIQEAITRAANGDTITVASGLYNESILITKPLSLRGIDTGGGMPIIQAGVQGDIVVINANGCTLSGFMIRNARMLSGVHVTGDHDLISGNNIIACSQGIFLESASNTTVVDNNITQNIRSGIALEGSSRNHIENNTVTKNSLGLTIDEFSQHNLIFRNNFDNTVNIVSKSKSSQYDSPVPLQYVYLGRVQNGSMGNYWSDYHGTDANKDGIGDTSYIIQIGVNQKAVLPINQDSVDTAPLMDPVRFYHLSSGGTPLILASGSPTVSVRPPIPAANNTAGSAGPVSPVSVGIPPVTPALAVFAFLLILLIAGALVLYFRRQTTGSTGDGRDGAGKGPDEPLTPIAPAGMEAGPAPVPAAPDSAAEVPTVPQSVATTLPGKEGADAENRPAAGSTPHPYFPRELETRYSDIQLIGRGGMAWVYSAQRISDGTRVAVKIPISFDEMTGKSFLNEIKVWEMLRHPNIVEISAVNILPVPYVEMEYVPNSLEAVKKPLPVWKAVYIVQGIADALRYAHERGIIHRDIKPHNILVTEDLTPKITDWGMSKLLATDPRKSSIAGFSLSYAAPEQVSPADYGRTTDVRTDIYQLGVVFYELVTGSIPFGGESIVSVGNAILKETALKPSEYNPDAAAVDRIIMKCLEKDPGLRYQSAEELLRALAGYLDEDEP